MCKKFLSLLVAALALSLVGSNAAPGRILDLRIDNGGNDAEQHVGNGSMDIGSTDLEFPYEDAGEPATDPQITAVRFVNVAIPRGTAIAKAYLEVEVDSVSKAGSANPVNVVIEGELTPDAAAIAGGTRHLESRTARTTAKVKWSVPAWTKANDKYQSADISAVLQEIINQDGWVAGNALMLFIVDDPENPSTGLREAESFEGEATAAPLLHIEVLVTGATQPVPASGTQEVTSPLFQWTPGDTAVMHDVYFGKNPTPGAAEYRGPAPAAMYYHLEPLEPGATYWWRVDEIDASGAKFPGDVWSFTVMPVAAHFPSPADGARDIGLAAQLAWTAGQGAVNHIVYVGTDQALVAAGDASVKQAETADTSFAPVGLAAFAKVSWRVDEVDGAGVVTPGPVWSFETIDYVPLLEAQTSLNYDNTVAPFLSTLDVAVPADLTAGGKTTDLALRFQGQSAPTGGVSLDAATGTYQLTGAGTDIWNNGDQFHYAYKTASGDLTMVARVVSIGPGTNTWAKGGVMIRQSLAPGSTHAIMPITANSDGTAGNGASFQRRLVADNASSNNDSGSPVAPPYWVKIERKGNDFSGFVSPDGVAWTQLGSAVNIAMTDPVLIGLAVTSHQAGELRTYTFDSVGTTGDVAAGDFLTWKDIGLASNSGAALSVSLQDAAGAVAAVAHPNPQATQTAVMDLWRIPLSAFTGVDLTTVAKMQIAVGNGQAGGTGKMTFADVRTVLPVTAPAADAVDVTGPNDVLVGEPNDGDWPAAETPARAIDDVVATKFLHFKGETDPTGIIVTPAVGPTVVTGLTFTTANDAPERDPVAFELSGSNDGVKGPWTLIARGAIDDFARPIAWPRLWKSVTPIGFANAAPYAHYKVLVTAVRGPASANSMQVAEIELLGTSAAVPKTIVWVSFHGADETPSAGAAGVGFTEAADRGYTDLLEAQGYNVVRLVQTKTPDLAVVNAADLVIISRSVASSSFQNDAATTWNLVTAPMIVLNGYASRKNRTGYYAGNDIQDITGDIRLKVNDPAHPIFAGISLTDGTMTNPYAGLAVYPTDNTTAAGISIVNDAANANGTVLATLAEASGSVKAGAVVIAEWPAGATLAHDGGAGTDVLGGPRLLFLTGCRENGGKSSETAGMFDLYPDGAQMFLNAVAYMLQ